MLESYIKFDIALDGTQPTDAGWVYIKPFNEVGYYLTGTARLLALSTLSGTPVGILLDRLEEHPDEVEGCDPQLLSQMVAYLRSKYPNGV